MKFPLSYKVLFGAFSGLMTGLFFGSYTTALSPVGEVYIMLMQAVVYPYIVASLLLGLGRLSPATAKTMFKKSWLAYVLVVASVSLFVWCLGLAIPSSSSTIISQTSSTQSLEDFLHNVIPENLFSALSNNYMPAVVVFCLLFGIALQHYQNKKTTLEILEGIKYACNKVWEWVIELSPYGVFALIAYTAGTIKIDVLEGVITYLLLFFAGSFLLSFWLLPELIACVTPLTYKEVLRYLRAPFVFAVTSALSVAALPYIEKNLKEILVKLHVGEHDDERQEIIATATSISYPLGQFGNLFLYLFIIFAGWYFQRTISSSQESNLLALNYLSAIGSPSSSVNAATFLADWTQLPSGATNLYVELMTLTRYAQVLVSVTGIASLSIIITLAYFKRLHFNFRRLIIHLLLGGVVVAFIIYSFQKVNFYLNDFKPSLMNFALSPELTQHVPANIVPDAGFGSANNPSTASLPGSSALYRIRQSGVLRVGFNADMIPFVYFNKKHELAGYDVAFMYELARTLNVRLEFIPFNFNHLVDAVQANQFDIAIGSIYVTPERLLKVAYSNPYFDDKPALIVRKPFNSAFSNLTDIQKLPQVKIAVFNDPVMLPLAYANFPANDLIVISHNEDLIYHPEADAALWTQQHAEAWVSVHPGFISVMPEGLKAGSPLFMAFMLNKRDTDLLWFLNYWLAIEKNNGFQQQQYERWILQQVPLSRQPRWSIGHNVLHWW